MDPYLPKRNWLTQASFALADQGSLSGANFLLSLMLARWLDPSQYGSYTLGYSFFLFCAGLHNSLILEPLSVLGASRFESDLPAYRGKILRLHFILTLPLSLLMMIIAGLIHRLSDNPHLPVSLMGASIALPWGLLFWTWRRIAYLHHSPSRAAKASMIYGGTLLILLVATKYKLHLSIGMAFCLLTLSSLGAALYLAHSLSLKEKWVAPLPLNISEIIHEHWRYGRWVLGTTLLYWVTTDAFYLWIGLFLGTREIGVLRACQNLAMPLVQVSTAFCILFLPALSRLYSVGDLKTFRKISHRFLIFTAGAGVIYCLLLVYFRELVLNVLYHGQYSVPASLFGLILCALLPQIMAQGPATSLRAMQYPGDIFWGTLGAALVAGIGGILLTYLWGLAGAAFSLALSQSCFFICLLSSYTWRSRIFSLAKT